MSKLNVGDQCYVHDNSYCLEVTKDGLKPGYPSGILEKTRFCLTLVKTDCILPGEDTDGKSVDNDTIVISEDGRVFFTREIFLSENPPEFYEDIYPDYFYYEELDKGDFNVY